ncbi:MAG: hypothetical protein MUF25_25470 [Pirellulaceae bacterium]|nr:hypothetical protein [Pirellulaceae bacterium]
MLNSCRRWVGYLVVSVLSIAMLGCGRAGDTAPGANEAASDEHDHGAHDHGDGDHKDAPSGPQDFPAGVAALRGHYEAIRDAFQANDLDKAHAPLHDVGGALEALPGLAGKAALGETELAAVKSAVAAMFDAYGQVDGAMHEGKQPDYAAVADKLDKGMADLQAVVDGMKSP